MPNLLLAAGMDGDTWRTFLAEANEAARFRWCPACLWWALCCFLPFFCNQHNKSICPHMETLCSRWKNGKLPPGIDVKYEMRTERKIVHSLDYHKGATLETYHQLIFSAMP